MRHDVTDKIYVPVLILFLTIFSGCLETASSTVAEVAGGTPAASATSGEDASAPQGEADVGTYVGNGTGLPSGTEVGTYVGNGSGVPGETNVGTYVGNGTTTTKNLISFVTIADESSSTVSSSTAQTADTTTVKIATEETTETQKTAPAETAVPDATVPVAGNDGSSTPSTASGTLPQKTGAKSPSVPKMAVTSTASSRSVESSAWPYDYCFPVSMNSSQPGPETQNCVVTPNHYNLGILKISLAKCFNGAAEIPCARGAYDSSETFPLYDGAQVDTSIGDVAGFFSEALNDIDADFTAGGLRIEAAYFEQRFPVDGEEAEKIAEHLRGKTYRICTTETSDPATMLERCGNAEAEMGDLLVDMNGDGIFGFMDEASVTETSLNESPTRPEGAKPLGNTIYYEGATDALSEITVDLGGTHSFGAGKHYQISIAFNIADTLMFQDGSVAGVGGVMGLVCVQALAQYECPAGDTDPYSVGLYNPYYDSGLTPIPPHPSAAVQEISQ